MDELVVIVVGELISCTRPNDFCNSLIPGKFGLAALRRSALRSPSRKIFLITRILELFLFENKIYQRSTFCFEEVYKNYKSESGIGAYQRSQPKLFQFVTLDYAFFWPAEICWCKPVSHHLLGSSIYFYIPIFTEGLVIVLKCEKGCSIVFRKLGFRKS